MRRGPTPRAAGPTGRARRVLRAIAIALAAVVALVAVAAFALLRDLDARVRGMLVDGARDLSIEIGRPISVGAVQATLGFEAQVVVHDLVVAAAPGAEGPLARPPVVVPSARIGIDLGRLARSRGREVVITRVEIEGAEISLARTAEGLSVDDVRAKLAAPKPPEPPGPPGRPPPAVVLERLVVSNARLRFTDVVTGAAVLLDGVSIEGDRLRRDAPSRVTLRAAIDAKAPNVHAILDVAPRAGGGAPAPTRVELHAADLRVAPILAVVRVPAPDLDLGAATLGLDATVELGDKPHAKAEARLAGVRLTAPGPDGSREIGESFDVSLAAEVTLDPAAGALVARSIEARVGPISARGDLAARGLGGALAIDRFEIALTGESGGLVELLPPARRPAGVVMAGPIAVAVRGGGDRDAARALVKASLGELRLAAAKGGVVERGDPVAVAVEADLAYAAPGGALRVTGISVDVGGVVVKGDLSAAGLGGAPRLEAVALDAQGPIQAILGALPPSRRPRGLALRGAAVASVHARADGEAWAGRASVDLGRASIVAHGLSKPVGAPLSLEAEGRAREGGLSLSRARLRLGPIALGVRGTVAGLDHADLAFDAEVASLAPLLALFPALAERLSGRTSLDGRLALQGTVKRGGGRSEVAAKARLGGVDVRRGLFSLRGDVAADVRASASGDDATISLDADLGGAAIDVALLAKKRAGAPARVAFTLAKAKDSVRVSGARVELPGLALAGVEVSVEPHALRVTCGPASTIVMTQLLEGAAPLVRARVPAWMETATVRFGLDLAGDPDDLAAASLTIPSFDLAIAPGHVRGSAFIDAVGKPRKVRFDVTGGQLAWPDRPAGAGSEELALDLPSDVSVEGRVHLDALRAGGHAATDVDLAIALDEGRVHVASLRAGIFGGTVRLLPSTLDLSDVPDLDLHARFEGLDLGAVPRGSTDELGGRLAGSLDVRGRGATAAAIWASLRGEAALTARDLHAKGAWEPSYKLTNRWLAALAERRRTQAPPAPSARTLDLREVSASLTLDRGKIATRAPIVLRSDDLEARLEGAVGADGILALEGRAEFSARSVAERSGGALAPKAAVPLRLRIGGRLGAPEIELFDLADTLRALRGAAPIGADAPF